MSEKTGTKRRFNTQIIFRFAPVIGLVLLVLFFAIMSDGKSLSTPNLKILFNQVILTALISIGGIFAFSAGVMDMSMSGSVCCVAVVSAIVGNAANSTFVMILTCVIAALVVGLIKAALSIYMNAPPFMITIVLGMALSSLGNVLLGSQSNLSVSSLVGSGQRTALYVILLVVFYVVAGDTVQIRRILYAKRNYRSILDDTTS